MAMAPRTKPDRASQPDRDDPSASRLELVRRVGGSAFLDRLRTALTSSPRSPNPEPGPLNPAVAVGGLWGSAPALVLAALVARQQRSALLVCPGAEEAEALEEDLASFSAAAVRRFPAWDVLPGEAEEPEAQTLTERLLALDVLRRAAAPSGEPAIVTAPAAALMQGVPGPEALSTAERELRPGQSVERGELLAWLAHNGYERAAAVESPGEFALRGGILDVFPLLGGLPVRVEFADDRTESLRQFDPGTQRSSAALAAVRLAGVARGRGAVAGIASLLDYLPADGLLALLEPEGIAEHARLYASGFTDRPGRKGPSAEELLGRLASVPGRLELRRVGTGSDGELDFGARSLERLSAGGAGAEGAARSLLELAAGRERVWVFSETAAERERLGELVAGAVASCQLPVASTKQVATGSPSPAALLTTDNWRLTTGLSLVVGRLGGGFDWPDERIAAVSERELLGRYRQIRRVRKAVAAETAPIEALTDLAPGDYVVHRTHGIARYLGMEALERSGRREEHLVLQYADDARLFVSAASVDLVARYLAPGGRPELSRLGSARWAERTRRAQAAIRDIAAELIEVASARERLPGIACPPEDEWNRAFAASFPYEDTPDQAGTWAAVRSDLESPRPADRLLCGDVGFGKTEIAVRAAFKTVSAGHQAAVLVPTTLLAEQHGRTFRERMADYPVRVEVLSRFRTGAEQRAILEALAEGRADVVIGTHRLLQADIAFRDLGLVIIDEEQRFGVEHKERLKRLRRSVNVLTLTATPIPRTLHMALLGLRDISSLRTAPSERLAVRTSVTRWADDLIRRAMLRELARDGQVYFVHNRVETIGRVVERLEQLVPEARLVMAHGQMSEHELDSAMTRFLERRADVLVSTVIIESGLDIPNVNTIFIDRADRMGLADLHQLRGRVGRYRHRAYCYALIPPEEALSAEALARVKALEEFSELGAGFRLAMRDLELRGAGNLLGADQSGHIAEIGYDLYAKLLANAAKEYRGEPVPEEWEVSVSLAAAALIPEGYLPEASERLEAYRRLAACASDAEIAEFGAELADRYGKLPEEVRQLLAEAEVRVRARAARVAFLGVEDVGVLEPQVRLVLKFFGRPAPEAAHWLGSEHAPRVLEAGTLSVALPQGAELAALYGKVKEILEKLRVPEQKRGRSGSPTARGPTPSRK
jgi:transcription-repair coupling factor (superfamily II helicase)